MIQIKFIGGGPLNDSVLLLDNKELLESFSVEILLETKWGNKLTKHTYTYKSSDSFYAFFHYTNAQMTHLEGSET